MRMTEAEYDALKAEWTDQFVQVKADRPELARFAGIVGRIVTVNQNGNAVIDFQDGGWYDITASTEFLTRLTSSEGRSRFDCTVNSAQPFPDRQV